MVAFPWSAGFFAVTVAEPQPLFVTSAPVSVAAELVNPQWPLAAAVKPAICAALAGPAVTREADDRPDDLVGLADGEFAAGLAVVALGAGVAVAVLGAGVAVAVLGAGVAVRLAVADDVEVAPPQAAVRHKMPTASPASPADRASRRVRGCPHAIRLAAPVGCRLANARAFPGCGFMAVVPPATAFCRGTFVAVMARTSDRSLQPGTQRR